MEFGLSESQRILKENARKFFANECPSAEVRRLMESPTAFDGTLWAKMAEQGYLGAIFPEESGGLGLGLVELAALMEEMGYALTPGPFHSCLVAGCVIHACGSTEQKAKYLTPICEGTARATVALLEGAAKWDLASVALRARPHGNGYKLSGEKFFVPDLGVADYFVVVAQMGGELVLGVVHPNNGGMRITHMPSLDETRKLYACILDDVEIAPGDVLATGPAAAAALERATAIGTLGLAAELTGGMQRLLEITTQYAKTRTQFGQPIGKFQAVQHMCADMFLYTESSRAAMLYAAWALEQNAPDAMSAIAVAKAYASDAGRECGNRAVQVHGGMGFTWENDVHLYYRRAKANEIAFGDATYHRERVARLILDKKASKTA